MDRKSLEHKTVQFDIKAVDAEGRTIEGYASTFGNLDHVGDIIHKGAFKKTLQENGNKVKFLWQHDYTEPIGKPVEIREDSKGLFIKAVISDTNRGRDALALLQDEAIWEMSIGYEPVRGQIDYTKDEATGASIRNLREIKLYEFSLVTFPANEEAVVTDLKEDTFAVPSEPEEEIVEEKTLEMTESDFDNWVESEIKEQRKFSIINKGTNYADAVQNISRAFYDAYPDGEDKMFWVKQVWDKFLIVEEENYTRSLPESFFYQVDYKEKRGTFEFASYEEWVLGEFVFQAKSVTKSEAVVEEEAEPVDLPLTFKSKTLEIEEALVDLELM